MFWIFFILLQVYLFAVGIRREERAGLWSWSMFLFTIAFLLADALIVTLPVLTISRQSPWFWWSFASAWAIAIFNLILFLRVCRRWRRVPNST